MKGVDGGECFSFPDAVFQDSPNKVPGNVEAPDASVQDILAFGKCIHASFEESLGVASLVGKSCFFILHYWKSYRVGRHCR